MSKKYQISKLKNLQKWENFEANSPQSSIFSSKVSLESFKDKIDLYEIKKGENLLKAVSKLKKVIRGNSSILAISILNPEEIIGIRLGNAGGIVVGLMIMLHIYLQIYLLYYQELIKFYI